MISKFLLSLAWASEHGMRNNQAMARLKDAMLSAQTLGELYALMEVYSYKEFMQIYNQLPPKQQAEIKAICDRDNHMEMAAINSEQ